MRFLIPVQGFESVEVFEIGGVRIHPSRAGRDLIGNAQISPAWDEHVSGVFGETAVPVAAFAEVDADDFERALSTVQQALAVLRAFQMTVTPSMHNLHFGVPGDVGVNKVAYLSESPTGWRLGGVANGNWPGFKLSEDFIARWKASRGFQFAAGAVGLPTPSEGQARALRGTSLMSRGILESSYDLAVLLHVLALEAMMLERSPSGQRFTLARRLVFLGCGLVDEHSCIAVKGKLCPAIALDPSASGSRKTLSSLADLAREDTRWRCSRWLDILNMYEQRSAVAHAEDTQISEEEAITFGYWGRRMFGQSALEWLADHPVDPIADIDRAIANSAASGGPDWSALIKARSSPPEVW